MKLALKRPEPAAPALPPLPERPALADEVLVHEPAGEGAPWIVQFGAGRYLRVGAGMARLLRSADGTNTAQDIAEHLGRPWTAELVGEGLLRAQKMELLQDPAREPVRTRRFAFVPPLTFQYTVVRPDRLLARLRPLTARLARRAWAVALVALVAGGLLSAAFQLPTATDALSGPLPVSALVALVVVTYLGTALHEMAHGAVLSHYGGKPSRMGVMLFYLTPAFFCDVTDGWRLPNGAQRVRIALAGITVQAAIGGAAGLASAVVALAGGSGTVRELLLLLTVTSFLSGFFNAVPFIKLDGYLALMSHLDVSHLRDRSMADARRWAAKVLFGGRYEKTLPELGWAPLFGLACMVFPLYVLGTAFTLWRSMLENMGLVGAVVVSLALLALLTRCCTGALRLGAEALAAGAARWRIAVVSLAALAAVAAVAVGVTLPYTVTGGFVNEHGRVVFVATGAADLDAVAPGAKVRLLGSGIVLHEELGAAEVESTRPTDVSAPFSVFAPVTGLDAMALPATGIPLRADAPPSRSTGLAEIDAGRRSLGAWLYLRYLAPFWR
ncbi:daptide biosynthesis intramembrane metalloprotease [Streptomyces sp. NPDC060184]|uniref:daptide biosynthesis intramembrane metalloprotease n=1 Tax=Streptomyces sp. NPDC060184 TaxID=3347064 RepID=UPI003646158A